MPKLDVISSFGLETNAKLDVKLHFEKAEIVNLQGQIARYQYITGIPFFFFLGLLTCYIQC